MMSDDKRDGARWAILFSALLPILAAVAAIVVLALTGCKRKEEVPVRWNGLQRAKASCAFDEGTRYRTATCVESGVLKKCVFEGESWDCAGINPSMGCAEDPK